MPQFLYNALDRLPDSARLPVDTTLGAVIALIVTLALYLSLKRLTTKRTDGQQHDDTPTDPKPPLLAPCSAWIGLTIGLLLADLVLAPRAATTDMLWPLDVAQRTLHITGAGAAGALLVVIAGRFLPTIVGAVWRFLLGAALAVFATWAMGDFLVGNEVWTSTKLWTVAAVFAVASGVLWAIVGTATQRTEAPRLTALTSALLLAGASAPIFLSASTVMAHTLAASALALGVVFLASLRWKDLARSSLLPTLALTLLTTATAIAAIFNGEMLVATLIPLALAPLALTLHRLPTCRALPGPRWLLPGAIQFLFLALTLGTSTAFASGLLEVHPDKAPWAGEDASSDDSDAGSYAEYEY